MFLIESIKLTNFKCYSQSKYEFNPGFNLVVLPNGGGKTTLVEGVAYSLAGSSAIPGTVSDYVREGSLGSSYVAIRAQLKRKQLTIKRGLSPRSSLLKWSSVTLTKVMEIQRFVKDYIIPPQLVRTTICCFQREAALIARADMNTRRKFIMALLRLDVIEKALKSLSSPTSYSSSLRVLEDQMKDCQKDLQKLEEVDDTLEPVLRRQMELLRLKKAYDPAAAQKRAQLQEQLSMLRTLYQLQQMALSVDSSHCPLCGSTTYARNHIIERANETHQQMLSLDAELKSLPPTYTVSPEAFSDLIPDLEEATCQQYLDLITQKRVKKHTLENLKEAIEKARSSRTTQQARKVLRDFLTWLSTPLINFLSVHTTNILKSGVFDSFELDESFNIKVDGKDFNLLSTGQQDYVATAFRITVSYLLSLLHGCPRTPLLLDSVGDSLDEVHYDALMSYLSGGATKLFSQVIVTSHRSA